MTSVRTPLEHLVAGLHLVEWTGSSGPVLCLPGLTSTGWSWAPLAAALPEARVIAPDLRGRGGSREAQGPTGLLAHAEDVQRVVEELDLRDVVLVGHSMGAYLAPIVGRGLGSRVRRVVLIDGGLPPELPRLMGPRLTRAVFRRDLRKLDRAWPDAATFAEGLLPKVLAGRPDLREQIVSLLAHDLAGAPGELRARVDTARAVDDGVDTFFGDAVVPALEGLDVPVHLVAAAHGKHDRAKPFLSDGVLRTWQQRLPDLTVERAPDNHLTILFSPAVARAVA